jgi:hypothetical protein
MNEERKLRKRKPPVKVTEEFKRKRWARKYPCRCRNRIDGKVCGARRSLRRKPEEYIRPPKCPRCDAADWRVDWHRLANPDSSSGAPVCHDACLIYEYNAYFPHRINTKGCKHYDDWIIERSLKGKGRVLDHDEECPF